MIDTHCHLTFPDFEGRVDAVLSDALAAGVTGAITVSTTTDVAQRGLELARQHEGLWCTAGIHPLYADHEPDWSAIRAIGEDPVCVAWGELGLDNHYAKPPKARQLAVLERQLAEIESWTAAGLAKPIVVHCRKAFDELLATFRQSTLPADRYVFHCFTSTPDDARKVLDFGAWISFTGVVTFRNAPEVAEAAKIVPLERIMVETDAPFLSPEPVRQARPNEPKHVVHIANHIADVRGLDRAKFEQTLDDNAERFFGITLPARA